MSIIADLSQIVLDFINSAGYIGIFFAMFMEGIITPIPSEMIVPFGGYLAYLGKMEIWAVVLVATAGSTAGSTVSYFLAQKLGRPVLLRFGRYIGIDEDTVSRSEKFFAKRGKFSVLFGHMVPGIRSIISYPAGICKMDIKVFLLFTFIGGLVWNSVLATVGFYLGDQWMSFWHSLEGWDLIIILATVVVAASYLYLSKRRDKVAAKDRSP